MDRKAMIKEITEQVINMYENNVLNENGSEGFIGWLEDGEVFHNNGHTDEEVDALMGLARDMASAIDGLTYKWLHIEENF